MNKSTEQIIEKLNLKPHPEGGYYRQVYKNENSISHRELKDKYSGKRSFSTSIYYLLTSDQYSAFHRIKQDEVWHFYSGSPLKIHILNKKGEYKRKVVGDEINGEGNFKVVVKGGKWFAASVIKEDSYSLVGCSVSPGFEYDDFEMADREELLSKYPEYEELITQFTK